jgi:hypothetical protein
MWHDANLFLNGLHKASIDIVDIREGKKHAQ